MLTGALGLQSKVSKEQREKEREEKRKLKQAKGRNLCQSVNLNCVKT